MTRPTVSICVTTHNDEPWVDGCLRSALEQTYEDFEVIVVDDASTDDTAAIVEGHGDTRIRLVRNQHNLGEARSTNRAVALACGSYIKFLHGDDRLDPRYLERVLPVASSEGVGLVVTPRHVVIESDDPAAMAWRARYGEIHTGLGPLQPVNPGRELFRRYIAAGLLVNRFSEPSGALVPRRVLERLGGLHLHMVGHLDIDLWARIAWFYDVGFVDEPLFVYRRSPGSASSRRAARRLDFLDHLWSLEGLRRYPALWDAESNLRDLYRRELRRLLRTTPQALRLGPASWKVRRLARFAAARAGAVPQIHGRIPPYAL